MTPSMQPSFSLHADQIASFRDQGYLALDAITTLEEVERLRAIFERLFAERAGWEKGKSFDLAGTDAPDAKPVLPQILNPVEFAPELAETEVRRNALAIARQILGEDAEPWFEHAIYKPPQYGAATPWHQDEAHRYDPGVDYEQLSIWVPLQPATTENGCMRYIPGSQLGPILTHRSLGGDPRKSALECIGDFDLAATVPCPLPPGGAAIHHCRTLHSAGANTSDIPRRAYILAFRGAPRACPEREIFPWLVGKTTPAAERARAWENRGGPLARSARRISAMARDLGTKAKRRVRRLLGA